MAKVSNTQAYFDKLKQDRIDRDRKLENFVRFKAYNKAAIHLHCIGLEREYKPKAYPNSVKIYNQLSNDQSKQAFATSFVVLLNECCEEKDGTLHCYNECKDFLDCVNGLLIARDEGLTWNEVRPMFEEAYEELYNPSGSYKHANNPYIGLWNRFCEIAGYEIEHEKTNTNKK